MIVELKLNTAITLNYSDELNDYVEVLFTIGPLLPIVKIKYVIHHNL